MRHLDGFHLGTVEYCYLNPTFLFSTIPAVQTFWPWLSQFLFVSVLFTDFLSIQLISSLLFPIGDYLYLLKPSLVC